MPLETSRTIKHVVQQQTYQITMEVKVMHNTGNLILKKSQEESAYEGSVKLSISGKKSSVSGKIEKGETLQDMCNRLTKLAVFRLADSLYPSSRVSKMAFKDQVDEGEV